MSPEQVVTLVAFLIALLVQAVKEGAKRRAAEQGERRPAPRPRTATAEAPMLEPPQTSQPPRTVPPPRAFEPPLLTERRVHVQAPELPRPQPFARERRAPSQAAARAEALRSREALAAARQRATSPAAMRLGLHHGDRAQLRRIIVLTEVLGRPRGERN